MDDYYLDLYLDYSDMLQEARGENAKLRLLLLTMTKRSINMEINEAYEAGYRDGSINYELEHCPACKNVADLQEALADNAKLQDKKNEHECYFKWSLADNGWADHTCSECGFVENTDIHVGLGWKYCPNCGRKVVSK